MNDLIPLDVNDMKCCYITIMLQIDVDENDEVAEKYDVQSLPTFICFKNHLKVERMVGANEDKLKEFIDKHTDPTGQ